MRGAARGPSRLGIRAATELFGLTQRAIRYYEEVGLVSALRGLRNDRYFDSEGRLRLAWISRLRAAGISLAEIKVILQALERGDDAAGQARRQLLARRLEVESSLQRVEDLIAAVAAEKKVGDTLRWPRR